MVLVLLAVYSPLRHYGLDKAGMKVGVVGLGGLGHAAVLIGKVPPVAPCLSGAALATPLGVGVAFRLKAPQ